MTEKLTDPLTGTLDFGFEGLYDMILAPIKSRLLLTALELKVFDHLAKFRSAQEVARSLGSHPRNTGLFLDGLAACDLLVKRGDKYRNSSSSQAFLVEGSPTFIGQFLVGQTRWSKTVLVARTSAPIWRKNQVRISSSRLTPAFSMTSWMISRQHLACE